MHNSISWHRGKNLHEATKEEGLHPDDLEMTVTPIYQAAQPVMGSWWSNSNFWPVVC